MKFKVDFIDPCAKFARGLHEPERFGEFTAYAAKGEHVALQLVVEATEDVKGVCVKMEPFRMDTSKYDQVDACHMKMYSVQSVYMSSHTARVDNLISNEPGYFPDPLAKARPFDLKQGETHNLLITLDLPRDAAPGDYTSYIMVYSSFEDKVVLNAKLHVYDFELQDNKFDIVRWIHLKDLSRFPGTVPGTEKFYKAVARLADLLAEYGETIAFVPWQDLQKFYRTADGGYLVDSRITREYIAIFKARGFKKFLFKHIGWRDAWSTDYFLGFPVEYVDAGVKKHLKICDFFDESYQKLLTAHLEEIERIVEDDHDGGEYFTHLFDEPIKHHRNLLALTVGLLGAHCPSVKTLEAIRDNHTETCDLLDKAVFLWGGDYDMKDKIRGDFFWYICMEPVGGHPNRFIDQNPVCYRVVPWLAWLYDLKGYLEWGFNCYGGGSWNNLLTNFDPRENVLVSSESYDPSGFLLAPTDAYLVYPDEENFYMPSLRLEIFKMGLEEYKYVKMTEQLASAGNARAQAALDEVRAMLGDTLKYPLEAGAYDSMKQKLGALLENPGK